MTSHTLTVHVTDSLTPVHTTTVTVSVLVRPVNEFSPVFSPSTYTSALPEDVASGTRSGSCDRMQPMDVTLIAVTS